MKKVLFVAIATVLAAATFGFGRPVTAGAADEWCWEDPTLLIDGSVVHINVGMAESDLVYLTGPVEVTISLPRGVPVSVKRVDNVRFEEDVNITRSGAPWQPGDPVQVGVLIRVPASEHFPVALQIKYVDGGMRTTRLRTSDSAMKVSDRFVLDGNPAAGVAQSQRESKGK